MESRRPPPGASLHRQTLHDSTRFLESAGCILFDFRHTGFDPLTYRRPSLPGLSGTPPRLGSAPNVVLIYSRDRKQYILPKGRRNISEHRSDAALRETFEETGLKCELLPVKMYTRCTSLNPDDDRKTMGATHTVDEPRRFEGVVEPFMVLLRETNGTRGRDHFCEDGTMARQAEEVVPVPMVMVDGRLVRDDRVMKMIWWFVGVVSEDGNEAEEVVGRETEPGAEIVSVPWDEAVQRCTFTEDGAIVRRAINIVKNTFGI